LASAGAVVIEGPKACGKTMTASQQAASRVLLDIDQAARQVLAVDPALLLEGARPPQRRWPFRLSADAAHEPG